MNIFSLWGSIKMRDDEYRKALNKAEDKTKRTGDAMERDWNETMRNMERRMSKLGDNMQRIGGRMSLAITAPLTIASGVILKVAGDFESSMNRVSAVSGATGDDLEGLSDLAKELGATTAFSASQAADAMNFLAMAGFSVEEVTAALPGTLELAAAGQLNLAEAADIASNVLTGFGLEASEISRVNDTLAATSTKANTDIRQLGEALSFAAPVAAAFDVSVEDSAAAVGLLSNAGIQASRAGTGLSRILTILSSEADELGINMRDAEGNMLPLADILEQIEERGLSADEAMEIFGQRGGPAMQALLSQGSEALRELTGELENAGGTAQRIAEKQMEGFNGAMLEFRSALEAAGIAIAESGLLEWSTNMARGAANMLRWFADLNPVILRFVTVLGMVLAATGPVLVAVGTFLKLLPLLRIAVIALRGALVTVSPILTVIALAVAGLYVAWQNNFLGIQEVTKRVIDWVGEKIKTIMIVGQAVLDSWETISWGFGEIVRNMGEAAGGAGEVILGAFQVAGAAVEGAFVTMAKGVRRVFADMLNGIIRGINSFTSAASGALGGLGIEIGQIPEVAVDSWSDIADETTRRVDEASQKVAEGQARIGSALRANGYVAAGVRDVVERNLWAQASTSVETAEVTEESVESVAQTFEEAFAQEVPEAIQTTVDALDETVTGVERLEAQTAAIFKELSGEGGMTDERPRHVPVALTWREDRDEAIFDALFAGGRMGQTTDSEHSMSVSFSAADVDSLRFMEWLETTGEGGTTEDPSRVPVRLDWQEKQDQAIFDALFGGGRLGEESEPPLGRDIELNLRRIQDEEIFAALFGTEGGETEDLTRQNVALDWQDRQDEAIFGALFGSGRLGETSEPPLGRDIELNLRRQQDEAIFAALFGTEGGATEDETRVNVSLEWQAERDQAIFDALFGPRAGRGQSSRSGSQYGETGETAQGPGPLERTMDKVRAFGDSLLGLAEQHIPLVGTAMQGFAAGPLAGFSAIIGELLGNSEAWAGVQEIFTEILKEAATALEPLIAAVLKLLDALWPIIQVAIQLLEVALQPLTFLISNVLAPVIGFVARMIAGLYNAIARAINWALGWLNVHIPTIDIESAAPRPPSEPEPDPGRRDDFIEEPGEFAPGGRDGDGGRSFDEQSFGRVSQGVQLAVATPLVEAAVSMKASADIISSVLGSQGGLAERFDGIGQFSDVLDRITPVLERLLDEGLRVRTYQQESGGMTGPTRAASLRGI